MSREQAAVCSRQRDPGCEREERETCSIHAVLKKLLLQQNRWAAGVTDLPRARDGTCPQQEGATHECSVSEDQEKGICNSDRAVKELLHLQDGSAAGVTDLPRAQEATCHQQEGVTGEYAASEDLEKGFCTRDGSVKEPLGPQDGSTTRNKQKRTLGGFLGEWFRSHPMLTLVVLILLLLLVLALGVPLAVCSVESHGEIPVVPVTPVLPACPNGWIEYHGICYFLSKDVGSWDQAQDRCSQLGASLAVLKDWEMEFLSRLSGNVDYWLGLRRRGQRLQWVDGSSFSSS